MIEKKLLIALFILSHLLSDFIFQTDDIANKKREDSNFLIKHIFWVFIIPFLLTIQYISWNLILIEVVITVMHLIIDWAKIRLEKKNIEFLNQYRLFLIDQLLHILIIILTVDFILKEIFVREWALKISAFIGAKFSLLSHLSLTEQDWYITILIISAYIFVWTPASLMVDKTLINFKAIKSEEEENEFDSVKNCSLDSQLEEDIIPANPGELIGKLERIMLLSLFLSKSFGAISIIFAAKSIARFNNFKSKDFVDYYIVGTFVSLLTAICIGMIINYIIYLEDYTGDFLFYNIF
ncbi:DUF3307 domain-containing protein [Orenia marismortui]|uniref:Uncharacterized protein DUF3307 n=1 Tax=Orenia marismortui TaxID=46469 RepID=A0A4V3GYF1_9FIRM|nr:DUF3307 domain-containing protein [Orenia marismortui]TDX52304.1 uncharacterized protein DUF3307 [Orenia marismortui]